jgi:hypothetical protein
MASTKTPKNRPYPRRGVRTHLVESIRRLRPRLARTFPVSKGRLPTNQELSRPEHYSEDEEIATR